MQSRLSLYSSLFSRPDFEVGRARTLLDQITHQLRHVVDDQQVNLLLSYPRQMSVEMFSEFVNSLKHKEQTMTPP